MKTYHAAIRFDLEQKMEPDGSYSLPVKYVEVQTVITRWDTDKNKAWKKALQASRDAKAQQRGWPRFAIAHQQANSRDEAHRNQKRAEIERLSE